MFLSVSEKNILKYSENTSSYSLLHFLQSESLAMVSCI